MRQLIYAGIGSRKTPENVLGSMAQVGVQLAESNWLLRSGHADGADAAFEHGCLQANGKKEIFVPWYGFNGAPTGHPDYIRPKATEELAYFTSQYHPAWEACSDAAKLLHMRNACQVFGLNGDTPVDLIICWTRDGKASGGTGTAIRMAWAHDIPVFNLNVPDIAEQLCDYVLKLENTNI